MVGMVIFLGKTFQNRVGIRKMYSDILPVCALRIPLAVCS